MSEKGLDKKTQNKIEQGWVSFLESVRDHFSMDIELDWSRGITPADRSPIEILMGLALHSKFLDGYMGVQIEHEKEIGPYRVDFFISNQEGNLKESEKSRIVIECDGHDFHEKNKEQVKRDKRRDRFLQSQGFTVFRYSGSEIWENAEKLADEIESFIVNKIYPKKVIENAK